MSDEPEDVAGSEPAAAAHKARETLAKRLADVVCLPASRIAPQERQMGADLLIDILREAQPDFRARCARRIAKLPEAPSSVLRWLATDERVIAEPVILESLALADADFAAIARNGNVDHRVLIAQRRELSSLVSELLVGYEEAIVIETVLSNPGAGLSEAAVDHITHVSRDYPHFVRLLSRRDELKPNQGLTMFWWADAATRKHLLLRFGVERQLLQEATTDVFVQADAEHWNDPVARKALQFIERRQRNRAAIERSPFASLEEAVASVAETGFTRKIAEEVSYLAGIKPATGAQILSDLGGEPIAVFCKATGLRRSSLEELWRGLKRPLSGEAGDDPLYEHVVDVYESLATEKAQTILRYWNWSLTSAMTPRQAMTDESDDSTFTPDGMSAAERAARLVWGAERRSG